jgi:hypothetical protein
LASGYGFAVLFASLFDGALFDLLSHLDDALAASEVDVGRGEIVERFVIAAMIVVVDEAFDGMLVRPARWAILNLPAPSLHLIGAPGNATRRQLHRLRDVVAGVTNS